MIPQQVRHEIPVLETDLHIASEFCNCQPVGELDEETGEFVYYHIPLKNDQIIEGLNISL